MHTLTVSKLHRSSNVVNLVILDNRSESIPIRAEFRQTNAGWEVKCGPGSDLEFGQSRKILAINRICELDAATKLALQAGKTIHRTIPKQPAQTNGPHSVSELVLPLLLPLKVRDNLFSYQRQGVAWLLKHERALLGDDMGLGKTAQALAAARRLIRKGCVEWILVVSPRTLVANWTVESSRWAPELSTTIVLPLGVHRIDYWSKVIGRAHILFTSYEQIRDPPDVLIRNPPGLVIADEAHRLRKTNSLSTQGFRSIASKRFWALTGTPIERDAEDLAVLLSLLDPSRFSHKDKSLPAISLRSRFRPYLLRRRKDNVLTELPEVIEENEVLDLTKEQRIAYQSAINDYTKSPSSAGFLPLFNKLRAICDVDPSTGQSSKLDRICELLSDVREINEKAVVFSYMLDPLHWLIRRLCHFDSEFGFVTVSGDMSLMERYEVINTFKSDPNCHVLLASTRVTSEGLTLTEANNVFFINQWWNPSSNSQARDRVVRIGQSRIVQVKTFTCRGTVEERLVDLLKKKSLTIEELVEVMSKSNNEIEEFSLIH